MRLLPPGGGDILSLPSTEKTTLQPIWHRCNGCGQDAPFPANHAGRVVTCPYCQRMNTLPNAAAPPPPGPPPSATS